jgi:hypothetical protein
MCSIRNAQGFAEPAPVARAELATIRATGRRPRYGFLPCGLDHEVPGQPQTWGPKLPSDVDWTGF